MDNSSSASDDLSSGANDTFDVSKTSLDKAAEISALTKADRTEIALSSASAADKLLLSETCPAPLRALNTSLQSLTSKESAIASIALSVASGGGSFVTLPNAEYFFSSSDLGSLAIAVRGSTKSKYGRLLAQGGMASMALGLALFVGPAALGVFAMQEVFMLSGFALMGGGIAAYSKRNIPWSLPLRNAQLGQLQELNELLETAGLTGRILLIPENEGIRMLVQAKQS
jgi:hypothetical protein